MGPVSITKLSPNWACQMGPIHCPKFLLTGLGLHDDKFNIFKITINITIHLRECSSKPYSWYNPTHWLTCTMTKDYYYTLSNMDRAYNIILYGRDRSANQQIEGGILASVATDWMPATKLAIGMCSSVSYSQSYSFMIRLTDMYYLSHAYVQLYIKIMDCHNDLYDRTI